jgi:hypothetical protein
MVYIATVAVAVNEISIPPEIRTNNTPIANIPTKEYDFSKSRRFSSVRKFLFTEVMMIPNITIAKKTMVSYLANSFFIFHPLTGLGYVIPDFICSGLTGVEFGGYSTLMHHEYPIAVMVDLGEFIRNYDNTNTSRC